MNEEDSVNDLIAAQFEDAYAVLQGSSNQDELSRALAEFRRLGDQGLAVACTNAGYMYANGIGTETDYAEARRWLSRAAEQGDEEAINNLAVMLRMGMGVDPDPVAACALFETAANKGEIRAQLSLGHEYESGEVVPRDLRRAERWFRAAAAQGEPNAMFRLSRLLLLGGDGIQQERAEGVKWLEAAARAGDPVYQYMAGVYLEEHPEQQSDVSRARDWLRMSADQGYEPAREKLRLDEDGDDHPLKSLFEQPMVQEVDVGPRSAEGARHLTILVTAEPSRDRLTVRFGAPNTLGEERQHALAGAPSQSRLVDEGFRKIAESRLGEADGDGPYCIEGDQVTIDFRTDRGDGSSISGEYRLTYEFVDPTEHGASWRLAGELSDYDYSGAEQAIAALAEAKMRTIRRFALDSESEAACCKSIRDDVNVQLPADPRFLKGGFVTHVDNRAGEAKPVTGRGNSTSMTDGDTRDMSNPVDLAKALIGRCGSISRARREALERLNCYFIDDPEHAYWRTIVSELDRTQVYLDAKAEDCLWFKKTPLETAAELTSEDSRGAEHRAINFAVGRLRLYPSRSEGATYWKAVETEIRAIAHRRSLARSTPESRAEEKEIMSGRSDEQAAAFLIEKVGSAWNALAWLNDRPHLTSSDGADSFFWSCVLVEVDKAISAAPASTCD